MVAAIGTIVEKNLLLGGAAYPREKYEIELAIGNEDYYISSVR
jgi:hypothetical protein